MFALSDCKINKINGCKRNYYGCNLSKLIKYNSSISITTAHFMGIFVPMKWAVLKR